MTTTTEQRTGQWEPHQFDTRPDGYPRWISYAVHLTGPAVRRALRSTKTRKAAA